MLDCARLHGVARDAPICLSTTAKLAIADGLTTASGRRPESARDSLPIEPTKDLVAKRGDLAGPTVSASRQVAHLPTQHHSADR